MGIEPQIMIQFPHNCSNTLTYHHDYGCLFYFELHDDITNSVREKKEKTSIAFENKFQRNNQFEETSIFIYKCNTRLLFLFTL